MADTLSGTSKISLIYASYSVNEIISQLKSTGTSSSTWSDGYIFTSMASRISKVPKPVSVRYSSYLTAEVSLRATWLRVRSPISGTFIGSLNLIVATPSLEKLAIVTSIGVLSTPSA